MVCQSYPDHDWVLVGSPKPNEDAEWVCQRCNARGVDCPQCKGTGEIWKELFVRVKPCEDCFASGIKELTRE
jgi:DnaJ-class molecular chaperone